MKIGQAGLELIKQFEGCRLEAYKCAAGVWTIGYGHTKNVSAGQKITQIEAENFLLEDISTFETKVAKYTQKYAWTQNEFDALVSFAFNIGSIDQLTANGTRTKAEIAEKILLYNKASGQVFVGLVKRRTAERELFLTADEITVAAAENDAKTKLEYAKSRDKCLAGTYRVTATSLRLRSGAGTNKTILATMPKGTLVNCYGYYTSAANVKWLYVETTINGQVYTGFASGEYLEKE